MTRIKRQIEAFRKGDGAIQLRDAAGFPLAGIPISVEQESHAYSFGCVVPDLNSFSLPDRERYQARLDELFNRIIPDDMPPEQDILRVDLTQRVHLGHLRLRLDQLASQGRPLQVYVWGEAVGSAGPDEREMGYRVAELYTLCFGHPAVSGIFWNGFADGETSVDGGLLHRDLAPKYAHKVLQKLIGSLWHSRAWGVTDAEGLFRFRGFLGDYRVVANVGARDPLVSGFALPRDSFDSEKSAGFFNSPAFIISLQAYQLS